MAKIPILLNIIDPSFEPTSLTIMIFRLPFNILEHFEESEGLAYGHSPGPSLLHDGDDGRGHRSKGQGLPHFFEDFSISRRGNQSSGVMAKLKIMKIIKRCFLVRDLAEREAGLAGK